MLLSFHGESKLVEVLKGSQFPEVPAVDFPGVIRSGATLAAGNITGSNDEPTNLAVQVTATTVMLFDTQSGMEYVRWHGSITTADISNDAVCVALKGGRVVNLQVNVDQARLDVMFVEHFIYTDAY